MDLTSVASDKAAMQAVAEGKSRLSNQFARNLLNNVSTKTTQFLADQLEVATYKNAGDYTLTYTRNSNSQINVRADGVGSVKGSNSSMWILPQ